MKGPYSPGVITSGGLLFVAGQLPLNPVTGELGAEYIEGQTRQALDNLRGVVEAAGAGLRDVVKVNLSLRDIADGPRVNVIYAERSPEPFPARTTQSALLRGAGIEIDAVVSLD